VSPTALEEVEVTTGGFRADNGSALSGVVTYSTRRGNPERWDGRVSIATDQWAPDDLFRGFTALSASVGGPLGFLGVGTTLFGDLLIQGMVDADPRARGLTCLRPEDADEELATEIRALAGDPTTAHLYCPYTSARLPYQRGDKLIGFARFDRPLGGGMDLSISFVHNRRQQELYTPEFKYNPRYQLGQRERAALVTAAVQWVGHRPGRAYNLSVRGAALRVDRYLGVIDPRTFEGRGELAAFRFSDFRFLGEEFVRRPLDEQLETGSAVPGYVAPRGAAGSPFGPAGDAIFLTEGTPGIAAWNRSEFLGADITGEVLSASGHALRLGTSARLYRVASYERIAAYDAGSAPSFARFFPATWGSFAEVSLRAAGDVTIQVGLRHEAFRSGLSFAEDRANFLSPVVEAGWKSMLMPRIGVALPLPQTDGMTTLRFNYGVVAQPPDFRFFLDTTLGDSLRADIRRQGNPDLTFERGGAWEVGVTHLLNDHIAIGATGYYKDLTKLATSSVRLSGFAPNQFTTSDFGSVKGLELTLRGRWPVLRLSAGYALQSATGVTSNAFEAVDSGSTEVRVEFPLAFDRRHSVDLTLLAGRAARATNWKWGLSLTASARSGYPLDRLAVDDPVDERANRLPWTALVNMRVSRDLGSLPGCGRCRWHVFASGRNILGRENVIALRRDTGTLAPTLAEVRALAGEGAPPTGPLPRESELYSAEIDLDRDGVVTASEIQTARFAAALDRNDPSLFFGRARELRLGAEVAF
jgi:hypothetical protein